MEFTSTPSAGTKPVTETIPRFSSGIDGSWSMPYPMAARPASNCFHLDPQTGQGWGTDGKGIQMVSYSMTCLHQIRCWHLLNPIPWLHCSHRHVQLLKLKCFKEFWSQLYEIASNWLKGLSFLEKGTLTWKWRCSDALCMPVYKRQTLSILSP